MGYLACCLARKCNWSSVVRDKPTESRGTDDVHTESGPAAFARSLRDARTQRKRKVPAAALAAAGGLSPQTILNWERLTDDDDVPEKATWPVVDALEEFLSLTRGTLWLALTGEEPPPAAGNEDPISLVEMLRRIESIERQLAPAPPAGRSTRGVQKPAPSPSAG